MAEKNWYDKSYKILLVIPVILFLISVIYLFNFQTKNNDIIYKDVTLTGGTAITVFDSQIKLDSLGSYLSKKFSDAHIRKISDFRTGAQRGFIIESQAKPEELKQSLEEFLGYPLTQENSSVEFSSSALSQGFYQQLKLAIIIAFVFMALVVFVIFRTAIPSIAVIFAALSDIVMTVSVVNFLGMSLSIAGVVAFLMLIGYSVDTDILLTNRILRKKEVSINQRLSSAFKTGITMTLTSIIAIGLALFVTGGASDTLKQIFTILLIGLGFDILNTWLTNASILKWYAEKKEGSR